MSEAEFRLSGGGQLSLKQEGTQVCLSVSRPDDGRGLYKAVICGARGKFVMGALVPEKGVLHLKRRVARTALEQAGCWPVTGGQVVMDFPFTESGWTQEMHPERLVQDEILRRAIGGQCMLISRRSEGFCLAARFDPHTPFAIPPLFCFAELEQIRGNPYVIFHFNREGIPIFPNKTH